ncbi:MAG TPA: TIGR03960 family B12-binding radical SAM protein [Clostridiaceae bacterium]
MNNLDDILYRVEKPARYIGSEFNSCMKDKDKVEVRFVFCFPDVYEVGMSHLGSKILYHILNNREDTFCERVYTPWPDMEALMKDAGIPLFALESKDPINRFDLVGFTLQYEMSYTNILNMLSLGDITIRSSLRGEGEPIVICGGPCAYNPEPLYDIADVISLGEGEEVLNEVIEVYKANKGKKRFEILKALSSIEGIYIPGFYTVTYKQDGTIEDFIPKYDFVPKTISKRIVKDLDKANYPDKIIVPYTEIIHDRIILETFRGCTRGCRFCQAGMIYRPIREKSKETLLKQSEELIASTGYDDVSLSSLSICDYSNIEDLVTEFIEKNKDKKIGISLPSIRIDSFSVNLLKEIQKVRKTGLTLAPEAGSQRMRDIINKGVTEEDLMNAVNSAFASGWSTIKLYFMIGLPYEEKEDVSDIGALADKVAQEYFKIPKGVRSRGLKINVSSAIFVPKAFTPFQWAAQERTEVIKEKIKLLNYSINSKAVDYSWHDSPVSYLEAVFARGDRKLCDTLIKAFELGAKFDGWSEYFKTDTWKKAFELTNIDGDFYAYRERTYDEKLPWDFIDIGVSKEFLIEENEKAKKQILTEDCRLNCNNCGINSKLMKGGCM